MRFEVTSELWVYNIESTLQASRISRWLLDLCKMCGPWHIKTGLHQILQWCRCGDYLWLEFSWRLQIKRMKLKPIQGTFYNGTFFFKVDILVSLLWLGFQHLSCMIHTKLRMSLWQGLSQIQLLYILFELVGWGVQEWRERKIENNVYPMKQIQ